MKFKGQESTKKERDYLAELEGYIAETPFGGLDVIQNFPKYIPRQVLTKYLCKLELFKRIIGVHGSIVECGVLFGGGLMYWAQLSSIFEPVNYTRKIIGFDTFEGFPSIGEKDRKAKSRQCRPGGMAVDSYEDLRKAISLYDLNRPIGHIPKVELVRGDAVETIPQYVEKNPHLMVSLLYLDFDLYDPTVTALRTLLPRMPKGALLAFDEINNPHWPGETLAVLDEVGIRNLRIERFPFESYISYAVLE